jgi:hypothetical protein
LSQISESPALKTGTVLLTLNLFGKIPWVKLKLNICESGMQMTWAICFKNFVLRPSMSVLDLEVKFFIVSNIVAGDVGPSSKLGGEGLGGIKSVRLSIVGLILFEIDSPMLEKKLLNSSAISEGLFVNLLLTRIHSTVVFVFGEFIASFNVSHVFLGSFSCFFRVDVK